MDVLMPQLGETVAEGKITKWFSAAGDAVKPGDNLFEIETDKVSMEVPAIAAGTLAEIRVQAGDVAPVGAVVAIIAGEGGAAEARRRAAASAPPPPAASKPAANRSFPRKREPRAKNWIPAFAGTSGRATVVALANLDPFFEVRTPERNFGPAQACRRHVRHAAGAAARRRERHRPLAALRLRPARPHRRGRRREGDRQRRGPRRCPRWRAGASAEQVKALYRGRRSSRKCRSTACAAPSRRGWSRRSRPSRTSISPPT